MLDPEQVQQNFELTHAAAKKANRIAVTAIVVTAVTSSLALAISFTALNNQADAAKEAAREVQEDAKAAREAALAAQAKLVNISPAMTHPDMVRIENRSTAPIQSVVVKIVTSRGEYRYADIPTLFPCMKWEVTDQALRRGGLRTAAGASGIIDGSTYLQVSFTDAQGKTWKKEPAKPLENGGYWNTRYNTGVPSREFRDNHVTLGSGTFKPIECSKEQ